MAKFDFEKQKEEFQRLKNEFRDVTRNFEAAKAAAGLTDADLRGEMSGMPQEVLEAMQTATEAARKASKDAVNAMMNRTRSDDDVPTGVFEARARRGAISA